MKLNKNLLAVAITSITAMTLFGCGTEKQDGGNGSSNADISSGVAVDGPITRAQVFYDLNGNGEKDSFEPGALTDNNGHYNYDLLNGINYCNGSSARPEFCLKLTSAQYNDMSEDTKIIIAGGYDLYTGEPFEGTMSFPANQSNGLSPYIAITPMTSMIEGGSEGLNDFITYLNSINGISGITLSNILNLNFLESAEKFNPQAFAVTYQMHKYVTVIADWVNEHYPAIDEGEEISSDISGLIYRQFENLNSANYTTAWNAIRADINTLYSNADLSQPSAPNGDAVDILEARLTAVNSATTAAFGSSPLGSALTFDNVKGRTRGVEVVVLKIIRGESEGAHTSALAALSDATYLADLGGDAEGNFNFTQLVEAEGTPAEIIAAANAAKDSAGSSLSSELAGKMLDFEDDGTDETIDSKAAIFFTGAEGATRGDIHLCLKYSDTNDSDAMLAGDYISGTWETLAALNNTVMLRLEYLGGRSAVLKKIGETGNGSEADYRFDFNGETSNFTGDSAFTNIGDTPVITSSAACKAYVDAVES